MLILTPDHKHTFEAREGSPSDSLVVKETWVENVYRIYPSDFITPVEREPVLLDIGANIGAVSAYGSMLGATVIAIEPDPDNLHYLDINMRANAVGAYRIFRCAVAPAAGVAKLMQGHGNSHLSDDGDIEVETRTLEEILGDAMVDEVDVCKIDIEGGEYGLIQSAPREILRRMRYITMEFDSRPVATFGRMVGKLALDFSVTTLGSPERGGYIYARRY